MKEIIDMLMSHDTDTQILGVRLFEHSKYTLQDLYDCQRDKGFSHPSARDISNNLYKITQIMKKHEKYNS